MEDQAQGIEKGELLAGLQILVFHRTLADQNLLVSDGIHTYIHTYFIGSSPRGFSESILHYKIINQVHDNKNITMIKEDKGQ